MKERKTGVFGAVENEQILDEDRRYLQEIPESDPNTIYNLFFKQYDEEKTR